MPVLADITYNPAPDFNVQRQQLWGFGVSWWNGTLLNSAGNPSVFQEIPFGGYRVHLKFKDWFWQWDNRACNLDYMLEDLYATAPGSGTPVSCGETLIQWKWDDGLNIPLIIIALANPDGYYWFQRFPLQDRPYWWQLVDTLPATPAHTPFP